MSYFRKPKINNDSKLRSYVIGLALGDGNLSNPNGRAIRLRITCDKTYPLLIEHIKESLRKLLPENKISSIDHKSYTNVSCYSNHWPSLLGWCAEKGSKYKQAVVVPPWIKKDRRYIVHCLRGLFQTDGSFYLDRGYLMTNFVSYIPTLANDVFQLIKFLGYEPSMQTRKVESGKIKHTIRISKNTKEFIKEIGLWKK